MDLSALRALVLSTNLDVFGVPATVTRPAPDDTPITTTGVWLPSLSESQPFGTDLRRFDPRRVLAVPTKHVPDAKKGTVILAPDESGGAVRAWMVDGYDSVEADHLRLIVKPTTT